MVWSLARVLATGILGIAFSSSCGHERTCVASSSAEAASKSSTVSAQKIFYAHREEGLEKGVQGCGQASQSSHVESTGVQPIFTLQEHSSNDLVLYGLPDPKFVEGGQVQEVRCVLEHHLEAAEKEQETKQEQERASCRRQQELESGGRRHRDLSCTGSLDSHNASNTSANCSSRILRKQSAERNASTATASTSRATIGRRCLFLNEFNGNGDIGTFERIEKTYDTARRDVETIRIPRAEGEISRCWQGIVTLTPEQGQEASSTAQSCQAKTRRVGSRMEELHGEDHPEDQIPFRTIPAMPSRNDERAEQEICGIPTSQDCLGPSVEIPTWCRWRFGRFVGRHGYGQCPLQDAGSSSGKYAATGDAKCPDLRDRLGWGEQSPHGGARRSFGGSSDGSICHAGRHQPDSGRKAQTQGLDPFPQRWITLEGGNMPSKKGKWSETYVMSSTESGINDQHHERQPTSSGIDMIHCMEKSDADIFHFLNQRFTWCTKTESFEIESHDRTVTFHDAVECISDDGRISWTRVNSDSSRYDVNCPSSIEVTRHDDRSREAVLPQHDLPASMVGSQHYANFLDNHLVTSHLRLMQFVEVLQRYRITAVDTWHLRGDGRQVCRSSRKLRMSELCLYEGHTSLEELLADTWHDVWHAEEHAEVHAIWEPRANTNSNAVHIVAVQKPLPRHVPIIFHFDGFPILNRRRALLHCQDHTVKALFRFAVDGRTCSDRHTCSITHNGQPFWYDDDVVALQNPCLVQGQIHAIPESSDDDADTADCSTHVPDSDEEGDLTSLMGRQPMWITAYLPEQHPTARQNFDQLVEDAQDADMESDDEYVGDWEALISHHQSCIAESGGNAPFLVITFGVGLTDLGRRDRECASHDIYDLIDLIVAMWADHTNHGQIGIHIVQEQPNLQVSRPHLSFVVDIQYPGVDDAHVLRAVLITEVRHAQENPARRPYAAKIHQRINGMTLMDTLGLDDMVTPNGIREYSVICKDQEMDKEIYQGVSDGDHCVVTIGSYPQHVLEAAEHMARAEAMHVDLNRILALHPNQHVRCCFHRVSPRNIALGQRDVFLKPPDIHGTSWFSEVLQLWPFDTSRCNLVFVGSDLYEAEVPTMHFVLAYDVAQHEIPILVRQRIRTMNDEQCYVECWAIKVPQGTATESIISFLPFRPFWSLPEWRPRITKFGEGSLPVPGTMYEIRLYTHSRVNVAAMLTDMVGALDDTLEYTSFIQMRANLHYRDDPFGEICCALWEQICLTSCGDDPSGQLAHQPNIEDNLDLRKVWSEPPTEISTLRDVLQELRSPWQGLSQDYTVVPRLHPVASHAMEATSQTETPGDCIHIFTDGSASKHKSAWSFIVLTQIHHQDVTFYCRCGYAADTVDASLGDFQCNAQDAEATAIIAACEYLLSLESLDRKAAHLHFDARNVGFGAEGTQNEVRSFGSPSVRQHHARVMMSLVQRTYKETQGFHVHAHQLNPWNEYADSLAVASRKGWRPPVQVELRSGRLAKHVLQDWAWIEIAPTTELPDLATILRNDSSSGPGGWPDKTLQHSNSECKPWTDFVECRIATMNVTTMQYNANEATPLSVKAKEIMRQILHADIAITALQETRARHNQCIQDDFFIRCISAAQQGLGGVEIWINRAVWEALTSKPIDVKHDICVWHACPRIIAVHVKGPTGGMNFIGCYAPQRARPVGEIQEWWESLQQVVQTRPQGSPLIILGDLNCRVGSFPTEHIGAHCPDEEDTGGQRLRELCSRWNLFVPSTMEEYHLGTSSTFTNPLGHKSRIDYILVDQNLREGVVHTQIDCNFDLMNGDHEHSVLVMTLQLKRTNESTMAIRRKHVYDRDKAREGDRNVVRYIIRSLPEHDWSEDVNFHWSGLRDDLQAEAALHFPKPKRQKRQLYFSPVCWDLLCQGRELRQQHREQQRHFQHHFLKICFHVWRGIEVLAEQRYQQHTRSLQVALTLKMRQDVDAKFRKCKRIDWKEWVKETLDTQVDQLKETGANLYHVLKPKKAIERHTGAHRRQLPGIQTDEGTWIVGEEKITAAWQCRFSEIENAVAADMTDMLSQASGSFEPISAPSLRQIPTVYDMERSIRMMSHQKAPGVDNLGAELFKGNASESAQRVYPLFLKATVRRQNIPEFGGGWLVPLHKKGSTVKISNYRGILLEPVLARIFAKTWRPTYERGLARVSADMQYGGRQGLGIETLHMQVRFWQGNAKATKRSCAILFADIRSAFYTVAKPLLTGIDGTEESVIRIFQCLRLPLSAFEAFKRNLLQADLVRQSTGSDLASAHARSSLAQTWFIVPGASELCSPQTGSRPGDPLADLLFGLVMSRILSQTNEQLQTLGLFGDGTDDGEPFSTCVTWVDDIAIAVYASADTVAAKAASAASVLLDTMTEHGLTLAMGVSKTAVMIQYHGKNAHKTRQRDERRFNDHLPVMVEHGGQVLIPVIAHYRHLGGQIVRQGNVLAEIRIRKTLTMQKLGPLKKFLQEERIAIQTRRTLMSSMGLSVMSLHAGTWFDLTEGEFNTWQGAIHTIYQTLKRFNPDDPQAHLTAYQLAKLADSPMAMEMLYLARLRVLLQILQVEDDLVVGAVMHNFRCMHDQSWLAGVQTACHWVAEQRGREGLPQSLFELHDWNAWQDLRSHVPMLKKIFKQAKHAHLIRVRTLCAPEEHASFQNEMFEALGCPLTSPPAVEIACEHVCQVCEDAFPSPAALATHMNRRHGERRALRRYVCDSVCRICHRQYHTRMRLLTHLHCGGTGCWVQLMRHYKPMTEEETQTLDDLDREQGQALHQKGLRHHDKDRKWRHCTPDELEHGLEALNPDRIECHDNPTQDELQAWTSLGALPTGQGGREKTRRDGKDWHLYNVVHETRCFEHRMVERSKQRPRNIEVIVPSLVEDRKFVLILYSGHRRFQDIGCWLQWSGIVTPISIDLAVSKTHGNAFDYPKWIQLIRCRKVLGIHTGPPCETYSMARWIPPESGLFPRPLRDSSDPWGMIFRTLKEIKQCTTGTLLMLIALRLVLMVYCHGGAATLEHPKGPPNSEERWCIWFAGVLNELLALPGFSTTTFIQGPLGQPFYKPTRLLIARLPWLPDSLFSAYDPQWVPTEWLGGKVDNQWRTSAAKAYPPRLSQVIASAFVRYAEQASCEGTEDEPSWLSDALEEMGSWDPFLDNPEGMTMASDYHPMQAEV